jgi:hypothetical protein
MGFEAQPFVMGCWFPEGCYPVSVDLRGMLLRVSSSWILVWVFVADY